MAVSQHDKALIEKYLDKAMTSGEVMAFEQRIASEPDLSAEVKMQEAAIDALKRNEGLKSELKEIFDEVKQERRAKTKTVKPVYWAAAAILILVSTFALLYITSKQSPDHNELYLAYYKPLAGPDIIRAENLSLEDKELEEALELYRVKNYDKAAQKFELLLDREKLDEKWWIYLANCYLSMDSPDKAAATLDRALQSQSNFTKQHAQWYMALLELKQGNIEAVRLQLITIKEREGIYLRDASSLLEELN